MKPFQSFLMLAAIAAVGQAYADPVEATTTPVGYVTESLAPNRDSLIGLTLHQPTVAAGLITSATSDSVTVDSGIDFDTLLTSGDTYVLEITNGDGEGHLQEITAWSDSTLTTPDDISGDIVGGTTSYKLRKAATVADVFGVNNSVGLTPSADGSTTSADVLLLPDGAGGFTSVFYYNDGIDQAWVDGLFNDATNTPLVYTDGIIVSRKSGESIDLVVSGEVKTSSTILAVSPGDNYVSSVYPAGTELGNSGLGQQMIASPDGSTTDADLILMPDGAGGYTTYFYYNDGIDQAWVDGLFNDATNQPITSGYVFRSKSESAKNLTDSAPSSYASL